MHCVNIIYCPEVETTKRREIYIYCISELDISLHSFIWNTSCSVHKAVNTYFKRTFIMETCFISSITSKSHRRTVILRQSLFFLILLLIQKGKFSLIIMQSFFVRYCIFDRSKKKKTRKMLQNDLIFSNWIDVQLSSLKNNCSWFEVEKPWK